MTSFSPLNFYTFAAARGEFHDRAVFDQPFGWFLPSCYPSQSSPTFGWLCVEETWPETASELNLGKII
jgi:hypothetical protein